MDANAVTGMFDRGEKVAVETALAGRRPIVPITAAKEYMKGPENARRLTDRVARGSKLREWLSLHGGRIGTCSSGVRRSCIADGSGSNDSTSYNYASRFYKIVERSTLRLKDARVLGSAELEGEAILTRDKKFMTVLRAFGLPKEYRNRPSLYLSH